MDLYCQYIYPVKEYILLFGKIDLNPSSTHVKTFKYVLPKEQDKQNSRILKNTFWKDCLNHLYRVRRIMRSVYSLEVLPYNIIWNNCTV